MLTNSVDAYIKVRRSMGFILRDDERYLKSFVKFAEANGDKHIKTKTALDWAEQSCSEAQKAIRLKAVIRFARYCNCEDKQHEVPAQGIFASLRNRPIPHIYTDDEIQSLMRQALKLPPKQSLRPLVFNTLLGLLAATGLRISEALALRLDDLTDDGLIIRNSKYRKSRLLPIHDTTKQALDDYLSQRRLINTKDDHLFISLALGPLSRQSVYAVFHDLLKETGIHNSTGKSRPRIMDLRHTFATNALTRCSCNRDHVGQHILALSTYLGHAHVGCTYWYFENTPQLMIDISDKSSSFFEEERQ